MRLALLQLVFFGVLCFPWAIEKGRQMRATMMHHGGKLLLRTPYPLPKNAAESQRLDAQHQLWEWVMGGDVQAPILAPQTILDVGCGTGLWCQEVAREFPEAQVLGIDFNLDPVQAALAKLSEEERLPNLSWRKVNVLEPLPLCSATADYVHVRFAATWIPRLSWLPVLSELFRVLRPGGWIELGEGSMPASKSAAYTALCDTFGSILHARGLSEHVPEHLTDLLDLSGFEAIGRREGMVGTEEEEERLLYEITIQGFRSLAPLLSKHLKPLDYATYMANLAEVERTHPHVTRRDYAAWGRKPL